jgi:hypothetical protein
VVWAEASRQLRRPSEILTDFVRACWPGYIADRLRHDLAHPLDGQIIDARAELIAGLKQ